MIRAIVTLFAVFSFAYLASFIVTPLVRGTLMLLDGVLRRYFPPEQVSETSVRVSGQIPSPHTQNTMAVLPLVRTAVFAVTMTFIVTIPVTPDRCKVNVHC